jgi:NTE family protein
MTDASDPIDWTGQKRVSLALQGGGSHGAFTWGVLDYLLEDGRLDIEAITGTSAGATVKFDGLDKAKVPAHFR